MLFLFSLKNENVWLQYSILKFKGHCKTNNPAFINVVVKWSLLMLMFISSPCGSTD